MKMTSVVPETRSGAGCRREVSGYKGTVARINLKVHLPCIIPCDAVAAGEDSRDRGKGAFPPYDTYIQGASKLRWRGMGSVQALVVVDKDGVGEDCTCEDTRTPILSM